MGNRNTKIVKKPNKAAEKARKERENKIFHYTIIGIFALIVILGFVVLATLPEKTDDSEANEQVEEMIVDGNGNIVLEEHEHDHEHDHDEETESEETDVALDLVEPTEETDTDKVEESENAGETADDSETENDTADDMVQETEENMAEPENAEEVSEE